MRTIVMKTTLNPRSQRFVSAGPNSSISSGILSAMIGGLRCRHAAHPSRSISRIPPETKISVRIEEAHMKPAPCKDVLADIRHGQFEIAHSNSIAWIQLASLITSQRLLIDKSSVRAAQVCDHHDSTRPKRDRAMQPRNARVVQPHGVLNRSAYVGWSAVRF